MTSLLRFLFFPHESNNHKPRVLHNSSLAFFLGFVMFTQIGFNFVARAAPGVLGVSATITPEAIIELTNKEREKQHLESLVSNPLLVEACRQKASEMLTLDYWAHDSPAGKKPWWFIKNAGYRYTYAGENLARDFMDSESVVRAWMDSPTHRDNIINSHYEEIGVAVVEGIFQGKETTLVVQMFGAPETIAMAPETLEGTKAVTEVLTSKGQQETGAWERLNTKIPLTNTFEITKIISLTLLTILLLSLAIDHFIISRKKIFRISGRSLVHFLFLSLMAMAVLFIKQGAIL